MFAPFDLEQSFYTIRFVELLTENIKRQHPTITYILRRQYRDADQVYNHLLDGGLVTNSFTLDYYQDVSSFLITPVLQRYRFSSPLIQFLVFYGLLLTMCETYIGKGYQETYRCHMSKIRSIDTDYIHDLWEQCKHTCTALQAPVIRQEIEIWKRLRAKHFSATAKLP